MTIETLIHDNTVELRAFAEALRTLQDLLSPAISALLAQKAAEVKQEKVVEEVKEEVKAVEEVKEVKKPAPVVEPEPEVEDDDPLAEFEAAEEPTVEDTKSVLPAGKRDAAFYEANVKPVLARLAKLDTPALISIVRETYGVKKADMIPAEQWDELVTKVQAQIDSKSVV